MSSPTATPSPTTPATIKITPMAWRLRYLPCQVTAKRKMAPTTISAMLPPMVMTQFSHQPQPADSPRRGEVPRAGQEQRERIQEDTPSRRPLRYGGARSGGDDP